MTRVKRDRTGTATDRALVRMLMEPTGQHFLDSGGAYGRDWQRNQATGMWQAKHWLSTPEITVETWGADEVEERPDGSMVETSDSGTVTLSVFHYLRQRLEFHPQLTAWLIREGNKSDDPWLVSMNEWVDRVHDGGPDDYFPRRGFNSYNEDNLLSQTIQGETFTYRDQAYVALQIHGGADVRGGYTAPKVFAITTDEGWNFFDWSSWSFGHYPEETDGQDVLPGMEAVVLGAPEPHVWDARSGELIDHGGSFVRFEDYASLGHLGKYGDLRWRRVDGGPWLPLCPLCGREMEVWAPYVS